MIQQFISRRNQRNEKEASKQEKKKVKRKAHAVFVTNSPLGQYIEKEEKSCVQKLVIFVNLDTLIDLDRERAGQGM